MTIKQKRSNFMSLAVLAVAAMFAVWPPVASATPLGAAITYQGQLKNAGSPANGVVNMAFRLWDDPAAGNQVGPTLTLNGVSVANGLFTVPLDFGAAAYNGDRRWLAINVNGTPLSPRQELTSAPYARFSSAPWATSGNDVSYSGGNVGIGTTTPAFPLSFPDLLGDK